MLHLQRIARATSTAQLADMFLHRHWPPDRFAMFTHTVDLQLATDPRPFSSQCMFGFQIFLLDQCPLSIILSHLSAKREESGVSCRRTIPNGLTLGWSVLTMRANSPSIIRASLSSVVSATSFYSVFQPLQFSISIPSAGFHRWMFSAGLLRLT